MYMNEQQKEGEAKRWADGGGAGIIRDLLGKQYMKGKHKCQTD